jgi:membrane associated rhomboid family serine protease
LALGKKFATTTFQSSEQGMEPDMRTFEIIVALVVAAVLFIVLKLIGLVIKFALIAAVIGFVAGLLIARSFRSKSD